MYQGHLLTPGPRAVPEFPNGQSTPADYSLLGFASITIKCSY
ncbi:unnamed protein product [Staurois parvus]|uniref:Uncharacterized protein n=1 Tax=Staurois parvus TaxID=386267 RepID=A0ABN9CGR9_9NEOB|nr:unnamed protein product [Staurois parvus]